MKIHYDIVLFKGTVGHISRGEVHGCDKQVWMQRVTFAPPSVPHCLDLNEAQPV